MAEETEEARRRQAEADRAALERLYGPEKKAAKGQSWVGIALLLLGVALLGWGAAMDGDVRLVAVGVVALGVGVWAVFDGLARRHRAQTEDDAG